MREFHGRVIQKRIEARKHAYMVGRDTVVWENIMEKRKKSVGRVTSVMLILVSRTLIISFHEEHLHDFCVGFS